MNRRAGVPGTFSFPFLPLVETFCRNLLSIPRCNWRDVDKRFRQEVPTKVKALSWAPVHGERTPPKSDVNRDLEPRKAPRECTSSPSLPGEAGGEGRGEEVRPSPPLVFGVRRFRFGVWSSSIRAPLSPTLSPLVPRGARETEVHEKRLTSRTRPAETLRAEGRFMERERAKQ